MTSDLTNFMASPYKIEMVRRNDVYFLLIPDLGVAASGEDISTAFNLLEERRQEYFQTHVEFSSVDRIPVPYERRATSELRSFFIKSAVVLLVGIFLFVTASVSFTYALREPVRKAGLKAGRSAINEFTRGLEKFAEKDITPEREARIRAAIKAAVPKLKPYVKELRPLFEDNSKSN